MVRPGQSDDGRVGVVERLERHHLVSLVGEGEDRRGKGFGRAGGDQNFGQRIERQAVETLLVGGDRLQQNRHPAAGRVLVHAVADRPACGLEDLFRTVLVRKTLAEVDGTRRRCKRRHLGKDGRLQSAVIAQQHGAARCTFPGAPHGHSSKLPCPAPVSRGVAVDTFPAWCGGGATFCPWEAVRERDG